MSHARELCVIAVSREPSVGVDIECLRPLDDALELAEGLFTKRERRFIQAVPPASRDEAFLALWTRKEAVVKAFGLGLSQPLDTFDVSTASDADGTLWQGQVGSARFIVARLHPPSGWVGAVCVVGAGLSVTSMDASVLDA
jgi:4'-phosphopantetheinyl transferase